MGVKPIDYRKWDLLQCSSSEEGDGDEEQGIEEEENEKEEEDEEEDEDEEIAEHFGEAMFEIDDEHILDDEEEDQSEERRGEKCWKGQSCKERRWNGRPRWRGNTLRFRNGHEDEETTKNHQRKMEVDEDFNDSGEDNQRILQNILSTAGKTTQDAFEESIHQLSEKRVCVRGLENLKAQSEEQLRNLGEMITANGPRSIPRHRGPVD